MADRQALLRRHVALFNQGVRSGDFGPMVAHFTDDAELHFTGIPVGPFRGRAAIAAAYAVQPPSDEIAILGVRAEGEDLVVAYAWHAAPELHAGDMVIRADGDRIARLLVVYGAPSAALA